MRALTVNTRSDRITLEMPESERRRDCKESPMVGVPETSEEERIVAESVRRLVDSLPADRIYLFGSRARGDGNADSDYDFMVVVGESALPRYKREQQAFRALCGIGAAKDVLVLTRDEFDAGLDVASSLPATVVREGRLLYARR